MDGDLNNKKSWHPSLPNNREGVRREESKARQEQKRIEQKRKEIAEERQLQLLERLQEAQSGKPRQEKLEWMYSGHQNGGHTISEGLEAYLLGKKKVDSLISGHDSEILKKDHNAEGNTAVQKANLTSDARNKLLTDPMLTIKKQEQKKFEELKTQHMVFMQLENKLEGKIEKADRKGRNKEALEMKKHYYHNHSEHNSSSRGKEETSRKRHCDKSPAPHSSKRRKDDDRTETHTRSKAVEEAKKGATGYALKCRGIGIVSSRTISRFGSQREGS